MGQQVVVEQLVPEFRTITGDIAQCLDCSMTDIEGFVVDQFDEFLVSILFHDDTRLIGSARYDVGQYPGGFILEFWTMVPIEQFD